jgi:hypothetical protein
VADAPPLAARDTQPVKRKRHLPQDEKASLTMDPLVAWGTWAAGKNPPATEEKKASPAIVFILLTPPAILVIALILSLVLK